MIASFDAFVADVAFVPAEPGTPARAAFATGDGLIRFADREPIEAHSGAVLCATVHPSGVGLVTGGDDGRLAWTTADGSRELARAARGWVDAVAASSASRLIAFAGGREVQVLDAADPGFVRRFAHDRSVADLAFDPKGRRLAAASYGGVFLWYARIAEQKPQALKWAGSHIAAVFSPDGRFLLSAMQENALHGWRLADGADLRMGGYPAKPRRLRFLAKGALMATSGAAGVVIWPFAGSSGPMGKEAVEIGAQEGAIVTALATTPSGSRVLAGLDDGRVWTADVSGRGVVFLSEAEGSPVSALALAPDGAQAAFGREDGTAGVVDL